MSGSRVKHGSRRPRHSLDSFEQAEAGLSSPSEGGEDPELPFGIVPPDFPGPSCRGDAEGPGSGGDGPGAGSSLADVIHFDEETETSGLLHESELLDCRRRPYDSGSDCASEGLLRHDDDNDNDNDNDDSLPGEASSADLMRRYMEATPRADTSLPDLSYASDGRNGDDSFGYSDDVFDHRELFQNNNNKQQYAEGAPARKPDPSERFGNGSASDGIGDRGLTPSDHQPDPYDEDSTEFSNTVVPVNSRGGRGCPHKDSEEDRRDGPLDGRDSDSASMSLGQFVPNAVSRSRLPRRAGKPAKRSTPKADGEGSPKRGGRPSHPARDSDGSSRASGPTGSRRSRNPASYPRQSDCPSDDEPRHATSGTGGRPDGVPRLNLRRASPSSAASRSLSSDASRLELSQRLAAESQTRQQADELVAQLQKSYDELLGKYARAENTIDQLKLGARVDLYGGSPTPGQSFPSAPSPSQKPGVINLSQPHHAAVHHIMSSSSAVGGSQTAGPPPSAQTGPSSSVALQANNNNVQGPTGTRPTAAEMGRTSDSGFPAGEGLLMALAFQVKNHQEQIDSFETLLRERQLAPSEQKTVLDRLRGEQSRLEADYMLAKEDSNALRRRNSLLNAGPELPFDPDRQVEGEIFQLGMKLEDAADTVQNNLPTNPPIVVPPLPPPPQTIPPEKPTSRHGREEELQERLRHRLENHLQKPRLASNSATKHEDQNKRHGAATGQERDSPELQYHSGNSVSPRNQSAEDEEEVDQSQLEAPSLFSPPKPSRHTGNGKPRTSAKTKATETEPGQSRHKQSHLPRPKSLSTADVKAPDLKPRRHRHGRPPDEGQSPRPKPPANGFVSPEADSGFMGSESSRQSNPNGGPQGHVGRHQGRTLGDKPNPRSAKLPMGLRSPLGVQRRHATDEGSPQFSDYDISEREEEVEEEEEEEDEREEEESLAFDSRKAMVMDRTPFTKDIKTDALKDLRRMVDKPNGQSTAAPSLRAHPSGRRHPPERPKRAADRPRPAGRRQAPDRRPAGPVSAKAPNGSWHERGDWDGPRSYPEPDPHRRTSTKRADPAPSSRPRASNPRPAPVDAWSEVDADARAGIAALNGPERASLADRWPNAAFDSASAVTRSSVKSEAVRGLRDEIERLKRQMAEMSGPKTLPGRVSPPAPSRGQTPGPGRHRPASVHSEPRSGRSEILNALQGEIEELRNRVNERQASPPAARGPPASRVAPGDPPRGGYPDGTFFDSPPLRDGLRESLGRAYIPKRASQAPSLTRSPARAYGPPGSSPVVSPPNRRPVYQSTPSARDRSPPPYIPDSAAVAGSPSPALRRSHLSGPQSRWRPPPEARPAVFPVYSTRAEPCPLCSGTGVHEHGEYSYPRDLLPTRIPASPPPQGGRESARAPTGPAPIPGPVFHRDHVPVGMGQTRGPVLGSWDQGIPGPSRGSVRDQQPVFIPQGMADQQQVQQQQQQPGHQLAVDQPQPLGQPEQLQYHQQPSMSKPAQPMVNHTQPPVNQQPVVNHIQPPINQQQPLVNHTQPPVNQQQASINHTQPLINHQQPMVNHAQPSVNHTQPVPSQAAQNPNLTPTLTPNQTLYTPLANYVSLVPVPVYTGIPLGTTPRGAGEEPAKETRDKKQKKSRDTPKSTRGSGEEGGTTIYVTPTKRRGRYYVLDDEESDQMSVEEEYYYRRTPRHSSLTKGSFISRKGKDFKNTQSANIDLKDTVKTADRLNKSSHRMLETIRNDISQSHFY